MIVTTHHISLVSLVLALFLAPDSVSAQRSAAGDTGIRYDGPSDAKPATISSDPLQADPIAESPVASCQIDLCCGNASIKSRKFGLDIELPRQRGTYAGYVHGDQDGVIIAVDDDAAQKNSLYDLNGTNQWIVRRMGYHSAQSGSGIASIIEAQIYNGVDRSQGSSPTGRREYGALLVGTSAFKFGKDSYSTGGNWWNIDSNTIGPVHANAADREQWLSGGVFFVKKRSPGLVMDAIHDGAVGILVSSTPAAGAGDAVGDAANGRRTYPLNAGIRVHGWSGPQSAGGGNGPGASPMAQFGLWVGGIGGNVWSGHGPRALFNEVVRGEDFDTYGIHLLNGYSAGNAAFVEQTAGGVGIWQAPQRAIPLLVGTDNASGLSTSLFGDGSNPTTLRITRSTTSPKAGDRLGQIDFHGFTTDSNEAIYARTQVGIASPNDKAYFGSYRILTAQNAVLTEALVINGSQTSFGGLMALAGYTVDALPKCDQTIRGSLAHATDVISVAYNAAPVGGGEHDVPVYCDGKVWSIR